MELMYVELHRDSIRLNLLKSKDLSNRRSPGGLLQYKYFLCRYMHYQYFHVAYVNYILVSNYCYTGIHNGMPCISSVYINICS